jgi:hypothetical protein
MKMIRMEQLIFFCRSSRELWLEIGWTDVGSEGYILVSCAHSNTSYFCIVFSLFKSIVITSYYKLDPSLPIFDHMNGSLFDEFTD